jgi:streptomycin 6-kinase
VASPPRIPDLDDELRRRLGRRFGRSAVDDWLDALAPVLSDLAERWEVEFESLVQRGSISVVIRCRAAHNRRTVLKLSPERAQILDEAAALRRWSKSPHVPAVLAVDENVGALLIEEIEPGTPLDESVAYPSLTSIAALVASLHTKGEPDPGYRPVADHIAHLFRSSRKLYEFKPELVTLISPDLYERSRQLAMRLAADSSSTVLLHGDLTPANVLDGGKQRGLVAIDPAPCLGDPAFDAVDLVLFRATAVETITTRAEQLADAIGVDAERLFEWCSAFAPMIALEIAERYGDADARLQPLIELAARI